MKQAVYLLNSRAKIEMLCLYFLLTGGVSLVIAKTEHKTLSVLSCSTKKNLHLLDFLLLVMRSMLIFFLKSVIHLPAFWNSTFFSIHYRRGYGVVSSYHAFLDIQDGINQLDDLVLPCGTGSRFSF